MWAEIAKGFAMLSIIGLLVLGVLAIVYWFPPLPPVPQQITVHFDGPLVIEIHKGDGQ